LPATSANLGSGFDAAAIALNFHLHIEAEEADEYSIQATGEDAQTCSQLSGNLILDCYRRILEENDASGPALAIHMRNEIPLGMGCGSSAAGRLAAVAMAAHFGKLGWCGDRILEEACALEGHPDNAAACWFGGFVAAANEGKTVRVARVEPPAGWRAIVVLPHQSLATTKARAVLPEIYAAADAIANIQAVSMLGLAFAQGRGDLLRAAMRDRIHQPYRSEICPLLPRLLPLAGKEGILGVALSGAGPSVLAIIEGESHAGSASSAILTALKDITVPKLLVCRFEQIGANRSLAISCENGNKMRS
jgi:homoserine kinase